MQKHVIKRQIIELSVSDQTQAQQLQAEVSRVYRRRIVPLIDRYCTQLSAPDRIHRIERLELDVGSIDLARLEHDLVEKVTSLLEEGLAKKIEEEERRAQRQGRSAQTQSQLELLTMFARTGNLPWWADASRPRLLDDCGRYLLQEAPDALRDLLLVLIREQPPLSRLVNHFDDDLLADLVGVLVPSLKETFRRDFKRLVAALPGARRTSRRNAIWRQILQIGGYAVGVGSGPEEFYQMAAAAVSTELGLTFQALLAHAQQQLPADSSLRSALEAAGVASPLPEAAAETDRLGRRLRRLQETAQPPVKLWWALLELAPRLPAVVRRELLAVLEGPSPEAYDDAIQRLLQSALATRRLSPPVVKPWLSELAAAGVALTLPETEPEQEMEATAEADRLDRRLREMQATAQPPVKLWRALLGLAPRLSAVIRRELLAALDGPSREAYGDTIRRLLQTALATRRLPSSVIKPWLSELATAGVALTLPNPEPEEGPPDLSFSDGEEIYVDNAGLVILWPFLTHFFDRLGLLLTEKQFQDAAARQRAVGLLQVLAAGQTVWPEYLLPLNKVLCSLDPADLFDFGPPVTETEAAEGEALLRAAIVQAPILKEMSPDGLRGTFLLRAGVLRSRDGAWLLQVERETYDVVLDRFPWGWEWVKLPWMETPLRVEW